VRLGLAERPITKLSCVVVVLVEIEGEQTAMGLLVDAVNQVVELAPGRIKPVPPFGAPVPQELLKGIGIAESVFVLILDVGCVARRADLLSGKSSTAAGRVSGVRGKEMGRCNST
jgi:purine-binding chemotaxis protein CheW